MASLRTVQQSASGDSVEFTTSSGNSGFSDTHSPSDKKSRYIDEFHELGPLGEGGCGTVMKVRNKTDQQVYALKMIELVDPISHINNKSLLQEAELLATLNHPNVVRYHASWIETWSKKAPSKGEVLSGSSQEDPAEELNEQFDALNVRSSNTCSGRCEAIVSMKIPYLFIQMELCNGTLRSIIPESPNYLTHEKVAQLFFGIIQGLKYVHEKGLSHRDLNPNNIFVDDSGSTKIGDFGLARLTKKAFPSQQLDILPTGDQVTSLSFSKDVGTHFYKAPEINLKYDYRVDLYSLGIILFEMSYPFSTGMERRKILEDLRRLEVVFPKDFLNYASEWQKNTAESLLHHSADERPLLETILNMLCEKYPLLDTNLDEVMGRALMDPLSNSFKKIIGTCFNQRTDKSGNPTYGASKPNHTESRTQFSIVRFIENVFRKYGADHVTTPLLTPRGQKSEHSTEVQLMTKDGLVVHLPHNAKVNFARHVVLHDIESLTRYETLQTYEEHGTRSHPRIKYECVFDIITSVPVNVCADAHVLNALMAVFNEIPVEENTTNFIAVSHTDLVKSVILSVGVKEAHLSKALELVGKNGFVDGLIQLMPEQRKESGIDMEKLERIMNLSGSPDNVKAVLLKEVDVDCKKGVELAIASINEILQYSDGTICFAHNTAVEVAMKWCNNVHFYSGIIITGLRRHADKRDDIIISDGGRFDDILSSLQAELQKDKSDTARKRCYGCGISVFPSKVLEFHQDFWPPELVVLTCPPNQNLEKEVYALAQRLRSLAFNCREELHAEVSILETYKQDENVLCLVEFLPAGEINLTHKFTNLNPSTNTFSFGQFYNPQPPTLKIRKEHVLTYFSVSFSMDMMAGYQMII